MSIDGLFEKLWIQYSEENPSVKRIHELFENEGEHIVNDHVAFRTFNDSRIGLDVVSKPFLKFGYKEAGHYYFPEKNLFARHFELHGYPRVFISELLVEKLNEEIQDIIATLIESVSEELYNSKNLVLAGNVFDSPSYNLYEKLRDESEYAAWLYAFGFRANHFTVSINDLKEYNSIEKVNYFLKKNGFPLNTSGGEVKGTPKQMLEQSSTLADRISLQFKEGRYKIPSCYYEFARRYTDSDGKLFNGFIAGSADKIFESTDFRK